MNQELKQRLIGAVVVTSLAAIFIPMIFDDPVDNSGQTVSELTIPKTPIDTGEESSNKLPNNAEQVLNKQDTDAETAVNTDEESELTASNAQAFDEPVEDGPAMEPEEAPSKVKQDNPGSSLNNAINKPIKTIKKAENLIPKQLAPAPVPALAVESAKKPAKASSELKRWYLQAGTFGKKENAESLIETLHKQGLPALLEPINGAGNVTLYRIKVGPTLDKKRASDMKAKLDAQKIQSLLMSE
jgi:DedD protein